MNEHKKIFSKIGLNYLLLALIPIVFQIIIVNIIALTGNTNIIHNINYQTIITSATNYILILPIFIYLMRKIESTHIDKENINIKTLLKYICIALTLMWIGNIIGQIITSLIGMSMAQEVVDPIESLINNSSIYINIIVISIMAPIFEELFFRKLLIDRTIKYGAKLSIILSALLFGLFHGNLSQFFYAFILGLFLAYVYIKTGKIIYTMILHAFVNFFGSVASLFLNSSVQNIQQISMANIGDITIILVYASILLIAWIVGLYSIFKKYKKLELNDSYREVYLEKPVTTVILNVGMILFIIWHAYTILVSLNIVPHLI